MCMVDIRRGPTLQHFSSCDHHASIRVVGPCGIMAPQSLLSAHNLKYGHSDRPITLLSKSALQLSKNLPTLEHLLRQVEC
ncbi:hypothetical protein H4Q26_011798 [Puccinia striiformis f. sp. tritici PST-130]|nr:hypothetical protein H4Q26_011798 [Puccinia striiformis f. sp. tritici PST-130]